MSLLGLVDSPPAVPLLDRVGVEAARLVHNARATLVTTSRSVTYALLAEARGVTDASARQWVARRRDLGTLTTVDHAGTVLIPSFQFDADYEPIEPVGQVIRALRTAGLSGWAIWRWFAIENPWIERPPTGLVETADWPTLERIARNLTDGGAAAG